MSGDDRVQLVKVVKDDGVGWQEYVDRIFAEKDKTAEAQRSNLEKRVDETKTTNDKAMVEAKNSVEARLVEAKSAADQVSQTLTKRLELLESGGAPFASRLDESLTELKSDVSLLNDGAVRTTVLDALREQTTKQIADQKRAIRNLAYAFGGTVLIAAGNILFQILNSKP